MKLFIIDAADGMTEKLQKPDYSEEFIEKLKGLSLPVEKVFGKLYDTIIEEATKNGFKKAEMAKEAEPDMVIVVTNRVPIVRVMTKDDVKMIFVGEIHGNCIDRFMAHNMNTFTARMKFFANIIEAGNMARCKTNEYHDTNVFEADFKALTEMKKACERLASKIGKLQENLTNGYK